ncbi:MAG TPA: CO dehydrogenase/CO-methylating acetyl-CoA synthase complex subunit beta [Lentisphaeria bacterium]|nr:MAG: CO dehydrogenase/CO-methylating acetyl-CoA synthase complex subunit beta [Lentisphaerae bacterium GWF2_49_21]HBC88347.1 CO dehydrogenase/CO-methylating acetyl-CoA synthase complex subunit beta [Lentisphaeria bacterium]
MSKIICGSAIDGAIEWVAKAEAILDKAVKLKGESSPVAFPNTAYYLPVIYSFTGEKMEKLSDLRRILKLAKSLLPARPTDKVWLPYLGKALDAGAAALFACEVIEACKYLIGPNPVDGIWLGAANDVIMRERGIEFVDGTAPGFAAITGAAPNSKIAVKIARELQEKNLYVFMAGCTNGKQFAEQLAEEGVQLGWETRLVPFGRDVSALIYALGFANRAALSFGGVKPGDFKGNLKYNKERIFAFVLALGEVTADKYAAAAGAINYGFPVIADTAIPEILPTGVCTYEHVVSKIPHETMVEKALEVRGCKIRITKVPIPVPYGPAFEGERIRKADVHVEFGGNKTPAFEFVTSVDLESINDGEIEIIGPDIDKVKEGEALPFGIWVEAAGRKMQSDFEPILERQIHHLVNGAEGIWHMGQRDIIWTRVSKNGFAKGLRLRHYGEILHAKLLSDYPAIVDKVKVTLITDLKEVEKRLAIARKVYDERNRRLESMTDESVDTFYSCLLCQSFAPNHVCIITPERLGLCGAYNWLDGKAAFEIDETGPNQPVKKGECLDPVKGIWKGINDYVFPNSHKTVDTFCAYSIMDRPMTSCGCFEVICAYLPECNGVMVVNREFQGDTPVGMTFSTLAGNVGGGQQTPGFMGCGKVFLTSRKFLGAEGGFRRLVWMPKELKELLAADLKLRFKEQGVTDLMDKIADETVATEAGEVRKYLEKIGHPAIKMEDMGVYAHSGTAEAASQPEQAPVEIKPVEKLDAPATDRKPEEEEMKITPELINQIKNQISKEISDELKSTIAKDIVKDIIGTLSEKYLREKITQEPAAKPEVPKTEPVPVKTVEAPVEKPLAQQAPAPTPVERLSSLKTFKIRKDKCEVPVWTVKLGAGKKEGGTRGKTYSVGGATCMPFHLWEGEMPNRPLVAMEVFDVVNDKYPQVLRNTYGDLLANPAKMAKACVEKYGADLISIRLEGTHPEKGNRSPEDSVKLVKSVLEAVDVPLIITGHNNFDRNNEVMKAVAQACAGENLLLNWVEQNNYRTIAGAALGYGHSLVAQSPIDVNIGKQLNILLTNMDVKIEQIVMDPMTGSVGYGIEYTYSVMERVRYTGLTGDKMLAGPMIVSPGQECAKVKEAKAEEKDFPAWGDLKKRAALWEYTTAANLLYSGADILIMYSPEAAVAIRKLITKLINK